jgi:hypothetical protein
MCTHSIWEWLKYVKPSSSSHNFKLHKSQYKTKIKEKINVSMAIFSATLQGGRPQVRFLMRPVDFFNWPNPLAALWLWGQHRDMKIRKNNLTLLMLNEWINFTNWFSTVCNSYVHTDHFIAKLMVAYIMQNVMWVFTCILVQVNEPLFFLKKMVWAWCIIQTMC